MNKTKKLLIDITFELLYKKGYCATSIVDILKVAQVTKGSIYYHFPSKDELVVETMEHYIEVILVSHWLEPLHDAKNPVEVLVQQINSLCDMYGDKTSFLDVKHGCPLNNFIQDMSDKNELFFKYLESAYRRWQESIEKALTKAQILKQTKSDFNPKTQSLFIMSAIEGSIGSAKAYNDLNTLKESFEVLNNYIKAL